MGCRIAFADDQEISRELYSDFLIGLGHGVDTYESGDELYLHLLTDCPDVVIADLQMPPGEWGGMWLISEIRKNDAFLPVIILSERGTPRQAAQAVQIGGSKFTSYVEKEKAQKDLPFELQSMLQKAKQHIGAVDVYMKRLEPFSFWKGLDSRAKQALANGEFLYHNNVGTLGFDFSAAFGAYAKALDIELRSAVLPPLKKLSASGFPLIVGGVPLHKCSGFVSTWEIIAWLRRNDLVVRLSTIGVNVQKPWLNQLAEDLDFVRRERNPRIHENIDERIVEFERVRGLLLGLGSDSVLGRLGLFR